MSKFLGFMVLAGGAYLVDAAVQNRHPLTTLQELIRDPKNAHGTLTKTKGTGFRVPTFEDLQVSPSTAPGGSGAVFGTGAPGADIALAFARSKIGLPYRWGATGPNSYDCSGLVQAAWKAAGVNLPRTSGQMLAVGGARKIPRNQLAVGDLVWPDLGHVQLYSGNGNVVEAPHTGAFVREVKMWGYFTARRVRTVAG